MSDHSLLISQDPTRVAYPEAKRSPVPDTCPIPSQIIMMSKLLIASFVAATYAGNGMIVQCPEQTGDNSYCDCDADCGQSLCACAAAQAKDCCAGRGRPMDRADWATSKTLDEPVVEPAWKTITTSEDTVSGDEWEWTTVEEPTPIATPFPDDYLLSDQAAADALAYNTANPTPTPTPSFLEQLAAAYNTGNPTPTPWPTPAATPTPTPDVLQRYVSTGVWTFPPSSPPDVSVPDVSVDGSADGSADAVHDELVINEEKEELENCDDICATNTKDWDTKCTWQVTCSGCGNCEQIENCEGWFAPGVHASVLPMTCHGPRLVGTRPHPMHRPLTAPPLALLFCDAGAA